MKKIFIGLLSILVFFCENVSAQIHGCTDPLANNYNSSADTNDGSCLYNPASVAPVTSTLIDSLLSETSGLVMWNQSLLTHNDNDDTTLYALDTLSGAISNTYPLPGVINYDWEDISGDSLYIYVGDFGNNVNGNRTDLHILRIEKSSLLNSSPVIDTIYFSYSDQTDFTATGANNTDFDCEAFVVSRDSIFLFTKQWVSNQTAVYALPKTPGMHVAEFRDVLNVQGMITGATYLESKRLITMCGYTNLLQPFIYLLYDFNSTDFFGGNKRRLTLSLPFYQIEGITSVNGLKYYCTNELFVQAPVINTPQKLHTIDLGTYLSDYLDDIILSSAEVISNDNFIFPVPSAGLVTIHVSDKNLGAGYIISDCLGKIVRSGKFMSRQNEIDLSGLENGVYYLKSQNADLKFTIDRLIKM